MSNYDDDDENASSIRPLGAAVIPLVNKLQDIFSTAGGELLSEMKLPQVAVVGSQSSGKSSVLEALVGRDFLPRGNDICTRRPLLLQLVRTKEEEYGMFRHLPEKKFSDFLEIRIEIEVETEREVGDNKGVSKKEICLTIYSPNVLDITLVDLPGMTKVPVGDQPSDIESQIRTMIMSYIKQPYCLILAVSPATDLANSDALQLAGIADPDGNRTIGVITKLDIMDKGTDANYLLGNVILLCLGYVGVVNCSQQDFKVSCSIKDALASEEKFFRDHTEYNSIADHCGIPQLAKKLNQILVRHIYKVLPGLKSRIMSKIDSVSIELSRYGHMERKKVRFASMVEGRNENILTSEVQGGAKILYIFQSIFVGRLKEVDPFEGLTDEDIRTAIHNATGPGSVLFVPEAPFQVLIRGQIARLLDPSLHCAKLVYNELVKMSQSVSVRELKRFPFLKRRMNEVVGKFLLEGFKPSQTMIKNIIDMEMGYINTSHPKFIGGGEAVLQHLKSFKMSTTLPKPKGLHVVTDMGVNGASGLTNGSNWVSAVSGGRETHTPGKEASRRYDYCEPVYQADHASSSMINLREPPTMLTPSQINSEHEAVGLAVTKQLLKSYYDIVRNNIEDSVPKAIMHFLVNRTKKELHNILITELYRTNLAEELLREPDDLTAKRYRAQETLRALNQALETLEQLPIEAQAIENINDWEESHMYNCITSEEAS